jgi:hypothetical protein
MSYHVLHTSASYTWSFFEEKHKGIDLIMLIRWPLSEFQKLIESFSQYSRALGKERIIGPDPIPLLG